MVINGGVINEEAINGSTSERAKAIIKASSDIPISARKEFEEYVDSIEEDAVNTVEDLINVLKSLKQSEVSPLLYQYIDSIINALKTLF